jgi:hypothetical protein
MDFPIVELIDDELSAASVQKYFHLHGLKCPHCQAGVDNGREFRKTRTSGLTVYRCRQCSGTYILCLNHGLLGMERRVGWGVIANNIALIVMKLNKRHRSLTRALA